MYIQAIQIQIYRQICVKHSKTKLFYTALFIYQSLCVYHFTAVIFFIFFSLCFFQETVFCLKLTLNLSFNINRLVINFLKFDTLKVYFTFQLAGCLCWREKSRFLYFLKLPRLFRQLCYGYRKLTSYFGFAIIYFQIFFIVNTSYFH